MLVGKVPVSVFSTETSLLKVLMVSSSVLQHLTAALKYRQSSAPHIWNSVEALQALRSNLRIYLFYCIIYMY